MPAPSHIEDPEKGTLDLVTPDQLSIVLPAIYPTTQISNAEFVVNGTTMQEIKTQIVATQKEKPPTPKKSKRKVSRAIRFSLWFNTYRLVVLF